MAVAEFQWSEWLPYIFAALMGIAILVYVILDGFDLGIGILSPLADDAQKDRMVSAIGPFWDANETWLVLAVGLLLVAFPVAHGVILTTLYFPVAVLLIGLILRGVAFEFRAKVSLDAKPSWNRMFFIGSLMSALAQGYMLGIYVLGLDTSWPAVGFAALVAVCLAAAYAAIGAAWLIHKTEGDIADAGSQMAARLAWPGGARHGGDFAGHSAGQHPDLGPLAGLSRKPHSGTPADPDGGAVCLAVAVVGAHAA
jgi:cytochrome d ubiquinol oxidase subunit II